MKEIAIDTRCHSYVAFCLFRSNPFHNYVISVFFRFTLNYYTSVGYLVAKNIKRCFSKQNQSHLDIYLPVDTGRKQNVHKTFRRRPGRKVFIVANNPWQFIFLEIRFQLGLPFCQPQAFLPITFFPVSVPIYFFTSQNCQNYFSTSLK